MRLALFLLISCTLIASGCASMLQSPETKLVPPEGITQDQATIDFYKCAGEFTDNADGERYYNSCMVSKGYKLIAE